MIGIDWIKTLDQDGIIAQLPIKHSTSSIALSFIEPTSFLVTPDDIADIVERNILIANSKSPQDFLEKIDSDILEYFRKVAKISNKDIKDETELPEFIDTLRKEGRINKKVWRRVLDLLLILDGLKMQNELFDDDLKLIREIASELRKQRFSWPTDNGGNISYFYAEIVHKKALSSGSLLP